MNPEEPKTPFMENLRKEYELLLRQAGEKQYLKAVTEAELHNLNVQISNIQKQAHENSLLKEVKDETPTPTA